MARIGKIGLILGMLAMGIAAVGASLSWAEPTDSAKGQNGLSTTGLGL